MLGDAVDDPPAGMTDILMISFIPIEFLDISSNSFACGDVASSSVLRTTVLIISFSSILNSLVLQLSRFTADRSFVFAPTTVFAHDYSGNHSFQVACTPSPRMRPSTLRRNSPLPYCRHPASMLFWVARPSLHKF